MARNDRGHGPKKNQGPRVNDQIRTPEVRLIGDKGDQYGVVTIAKANDIAREQGLDLVEVSPNAKPPVIKLIDYGKFKYQQQKKASEAKKKQVTITVKEVKFRPGIDIGDLNVKMKRVVKFIGQGDKVKMLMQFRGREMAHKEIGLDKFKEIINQAVEQTGAVIEAPVKMMGNRAIGMLAPAKKS
ncbi:MAG: translation initiation factor IF-3 [Bacteriovoracaceae bacterium]|nr:translation initiation factor IF-3 [Bacteriovoracaceae bacterium]